MNLIIFNHQGGIFGVHMIWKGQKYGRSMTRVHDREDPLVEFWDLSRVVAPTLEFLEQQGAQFVQSYYAKTVNDIEFAGLDLYLSEPTWKLDALAVTMVQRYLRAELTRMATSQGARVIPTAGKGTSR